ncbi:hypothetical protein ABEB36_003863 [Hypothenemus hampei]|uniref:Uncharacterized protein n=1 Tax=Hypothenemus hampei TaxID=57062 RepID=A0ABD1F2Q4_HYPHA
MVPSVRNVYEREPGLDVEHKEAIFIVVENDSSINTNRIAGIYQIRHASALKTLYIDRLHTFHVQITLQKTINENRKLHKYVLFIDETQFNRDGINNLHNEHQLFDKNLRSTFKSENILNKFPNHWIGRDGPYNWSLRSPDFNPLDYFLWTV